tara:strand:+ start:3313 stop:4101 length:789 start_codon:yes stop_codon:yes gene_type:complete
MITVMMPVMFTEPAWQVPMTRYSLECLTVEPGEDFNVVVVETGSDFFMPGDNFDPWSIGINVLDYKYINMEGKTQWTTDANEGLKACDREFIVHTGNDIFVRPGWARELLRPFEDYDDCGVSCLASSDLPRPLCDLGDFTVEGIYGPFMMFRRETHNRDFPWQNARNGELDSTGSFIEFDEEFPDIFSDTDLILAHYAAGLRSYRNHRSRVSHLNKATYDTMHSQEEQKERSMKYGQQMADKHFKACGHLRMYHHLLEGHVV